jgi:antitoxin (DNA-binding transcriptional repressor) of toxin-antitoxin stability system
MRDIHRRLFINFLSALQFCGLSFATRKPALQAELHDLSVVPLPRGVLIEKMNRLIHRVDELVDGDTVLVSISDMISITSKELHEQTGALLDRVKRGQRFRVLRGGETDAMLVPATDQIDPTWDEIMADVRKARAQGKPLRPNPILAERRKRKYAARVRR